MNWTEVKIFTSTQGIDIICGELLQTGIKGFVIEDSNDFKAFLQEDVPDWSYIDEDLMKLKDCETNIKLYVADNPQGIEQLAYVREILARMKIKDSENLLGRLELELCAVDEEEWSTAWKKYYHPVRVGKRLLVCPAWELPQNKDDEIVVTLNPGMAFGTGTHDTTRLCMELLEEYLTPEDTVLDVGCGSGILAITAALLGAKKISGCDIDEVAVQVSIENAELNKVSDKIAFHQGDLTAHTQGSFQVICANIVADVIIRLCDDVGKYLAPDGVFIASGIIDEREEDVLCVMQEKGFDIISRNAAGGWVAVAAKLREKAGDK